MLRKFMAGLSVLICLSGSYPAIAQEKQETAKSRYSGLSLSIGLEYEEGDYGTAYTTRSWTAPLGIRFRHDNFLFEVVVPYITAESSGAITVLARGGRRSLSGTTTTTAQRESGIGDITLAGSYFLPR